MMKNSKLRTINDKGYTLIELLAAMGIFAVVGTLIVIILFTTLRGSKKSDLLVSLRNNGEFTLSQMTNTIRYAKSLDAPNTCTTPVTVDSITMTSLDDEQTTYLCPADISEGISANGVSLFDTKAAKVDACSFTCSQESSFDPPTITIQFTLSQRESNSFIEGNASIPFQTSVTMRNFKP